MDIPWYEAVEIIEPYVVRISTPRGSGTGFLISFSEASDLCGIATAAHVVDHAHYWEEPIRIQHHQSGKVLLVRQSDRALFIDHAMDTAVMIIRKEKLPLPNKTLGVIGKDESLRVGNDVGWLGFPAVAQSDLCFFSGKVSAWKESDETYLVDGVAINGVSGGPAFFIDDKLPEVIGVVSAYVPNRATGETLPGLAVITGVSQFHEMAPTFQTIEEAKVKESPTDVPPASTEPDDAEKTRR